MHLSLETSVSFLLLSHGLISSIAHTREQVQAGIFMLHKAIDLAESLDSRWPNHASVHDVQAKEVHNPVPAPKAPTPSDSEAPTPSVATLVDTFVFPDI